MISTDTSDRRANLKANLLQRLHDPLQLRICVVTVVLLLGYASIYMPLSEQIVNTTQKLDRDKKLLDLAGTVEQLQTQYHSFENRLPKQTDSKEWMQYMLSGVRRLPVKLLNLDCRPPIPVGPYKAIIMQMELEGSFFDLDTFLRWIDSDKRLMRADDIRMTPGPGNRETMFMQVTVLGLAN